MSQAQKALKKTNKRGNGNSAARGAQQSRAVVKTYRNFIGGKWVASASGETFENKNPADTRDVVGRFPLSMAEDVERAIDAAANAARGWRSMPAPRRAEILFRLGEILIRHKDRFAAEMTREMGKVL